MLKLRPKLEHQLSLQYKMEILDACQEISLDEAGGEANSANPLIPQWLDKKYADVLLNKEIIKQEFSQRERSLGNLFNHITQD